MLQSAMLHGMLQVDMSKDAEVEDMATTVLHEHGRIDILVNNAARFVFNSATEVTEAGERLYLYESLRLLEVLQW